MCRFAFRSSAPTRTESIAQVADASLLSQVSRTSRTGEETGATRRRGRRELACRSESFVTSRGDVGSTSTGTNDPGCSVWLVAALRTHGAYVVFRDASPPLPGGR